MFEELLNYDPATISPEIREEVAAILKARSELLVAQAEVAGLRARQWASEDGLGDLIDLKAADLARLREDYGNKGVALFKNAVNVEGLLEMLPMFAVALLQQFKIPLPVLMEAVGMDIDGIKLLVEMARDAISEL